jgi:hypothetical protein
MIFKYVALASIIGSGALAAPFTPIDGTYELTHRVLASGKVVRPPDVRAIYTMRRGRFSLNLFFKNAEGRQATEASIGRFTFTPTRYCEWIEVTARVNIDHPGVTNEKPVLKNHCAPVRRTGGDYRFVAPGENVTVTYSATGFAARIDNGDTDYWTKIAP